MRFVLGIFVVLLTPPGLPSGGFRWERTITPPRGAGLAQACVVLDAATFANAAPALRDLRLFQDGTELPYAVEESYDERALESGVTGTDDRSLYETSVAADLRPRLRAGEEGPGLGSYSVVDLPRRVPVERLRLEPVPEGVRRVVVLAREKFALGRTAAWETVEGFVDAAHPVLPLTLGANLQRDAELTVTVEGAGQVERRAVLEMRRRSLCYQPRSGSALTLYLGGEEGMAAKTYSYASTFSTALDRPFATLGPLVPNPEETKPGRPVDVRRRVLWAAILAGCFFVFSASRMLRGQRRASSTSR